MKFNPDKHHRRSIRLKNYDYSQSGAYFITICTQNRKCLLGNIVRDEMMANELGKMAEFTWYDLPNHNKDIMLDAFVVMPNHVHGIIFITDTVGAGSKPALPVHSKPAQEAVPKGHGLSEIIRQLKTFSAKRINQHRQTPNNPIWQRNYYEHIIRDEFELQKTREYIINNPLNWRTDEDYGD